MRVRLPADWRSTGDEYDGCSRYARTGSIQHTLSSTRSTAHDGRLSRLYATHPDWSYREFPVELCVFAYGLPERVSTYAAECACPCTYRPLHRFLCQSLYGDPGALCPRLFRDRVAHCFQEAWSMGATGTGLSSRLS